MKKLFSVVFATVLCLSIFVVGDVAASGSSLKANPQVNYMKRKTRHIAHRTKYKTKYLAHRTKLGTKHGYQKTKHGTKKTYYKAKEKVQ